MGVGTRGGGDGGVLQFDGDGAGSMGPSRGSYEGERGETEGATVHFKSRVGRDRGVGLSFVSGMQRKGRR